MREQLYAYEPNALLAYLDRLENAPAHQIELSASIFGDIPDPDEEDLCETDAATNTMTITIEGPLSMSGPPPLARLFGYQGTSYKAIMNACAKALAQKPKAVVLAINSPGGEVAGVDQCWQAVRALSRTIPTRAENTGMMASAAYWLASACTEIVATSPACEQGSVGVIIAGIDDTKFGEEMGFRRVRIVSRNAPKKGAGVDTKAGRDVLQERADAIESVFIGRIVEGRGHGITSARVAEDFGQGALLVASEAERVGMIDGLVAPAAVLALAPVAPTQIPASPTSTVTVVDMSRDLAANFPPPTQHRRIPMTLAELLQANPGARAEYDTALKAEREAGRKDVQSRIDAAKPFLALAATPTGYTADDVTQIQNLAADVVSGAEDVSALRSFVRYVDRDVEKRKAAAAVAETEGVPPTPAQQHVLTDPKAVVVGSTPAAAEAELAAVVARDKLAAGRK